MAETVDSVLRDIWREQMHVEPRLLERLPRDVAARLPHVLAPAEALTRELRLLPPGILRLWRDSGRGHVLFTAGESGYRPGPQRWRPSPTAGDGGADHTCVGLCLLPTPQVMELPMPAPLPLLSFLDHLLGSGAEPEGATFSTGAGADALLAEAAARFREIEALGYGHQVLGACDAGEYWARALWLYAHDRQRLTVLDPPLSRLLAATLFRPAFLRRRGGRP